MKKLLPVLAVAVLLVLAGCAGPTTEYSAPPAEVSDSVAEENDYEIKGVEQFTINESVEVNGGEYQVTATNWMTMYEKSEKIELGTTGQEVTVMSLFGVVSTPSIEFAGQEFNPLVRTPTDEVITRVTKKNEQIIVKDKVGESTVTHSRTGQDITVEKYDAEFNMSQTNQTVDGYILISVFSHNDAVIVTVGAYPDQYDQEDAIKQMIKNVETTEEPPTVEDGESN